jgi:hypothetical protein
MAKAGLKNAVDKIIKWTYKNNGFRISAKKDKIDIDIWNRALERRPMIRICINNVEIKMTNHHCILGLIFTWRQNWKQHIKDVKTRAIKKLNIIKSLASKKWDGDQQTFHQMIILPTLRYGDATYWTASPTKLKTLDPAVCRTEIVLHEAGISSLEEIREQDTARIAIRVFTNESHPIL